MKTHAAAGGGLAGGLVALGVASGCLGAKLLVFVGLSAGTLGFLEALEPYRWLILLVGTGALAVLGWRLGHGVVGRRPERSARTR